MVKNTNAEQALTGEASNSRQKRQQPPSTVEANEQDESGGGTESRTEVRSGSLFDLDLLDCPVCFNALTTSIFQVLFLTYFCSSSLLLLGLLYMDHGYVI
ncbi:unnamed protein product [Microthlaspi erraticum]|uniref:Uncharacterized protein n=1 Tax=Microthlaspi erraticum TaxID=1685480 RepID=A0A6D2IZG1_9BRAS|nr:unnamed protein product [Microthlaspi erraticum]